ncbi:MAG TPA: shikimate kinase [Verrucomicrobia subdivision 6 bacterium]|jgi:shikimate kinase|uniref:Shikimate kinase n=2 Tax=Verrucomicrobia subdivision 6 TaxID=134627 RepID=A0A0R2X8G9_9BACT|nr:MAG: hypothetical protein ABR82_03845 [Verrucomicrobia subdivision 6 bacterium BACL9 MAG-120507-bin52]KRP32357.1 MAG: hypothetical protein ABS32_04030 [Verrucomicrobia subdivision 6 bacterium BACL9 MAG-120820-bin42]HBZ84491.1 shikimate kinase [Verrucomicrobia subdivision 6 bacterium]HCP06335.1 shikimate kinase [Verrucomicrobiales bacterium]
MQRTTHLWLLGLSGSGKSCVGPILAKKLSLPFLDTDQTITKTAHLSIPQIFSQGGEQEFRRWESQIVTQLSQSEPSVIACGAGVILDPQNRRTLAETGKRIYLRAEIATLVQRLSHHRDRPLLPADQLQPKLTQQFSERAPWYEQSEIQISIGSDTPEQISEKIIAALTKA